MNFPFRTPAVSESQPPPHPGPQGMELGKKSEATRLLGKPVGEATLEAGMVYCPNLNEESPFRTLESSKSQGIFKYSKICIC